MTSLHASVEGVQDISPLLFHSRKIHRAVPAPTTCLPPIFMRWRLQIQAVSATEQLAQEIPQPAAVISSEELFAASDESVHSSGSVLSTPLRRASKLVVEADCAVGTEMDTVLKESHLSTACERARSSDRQSSVKLPTPQAWQQPGDCVLCGDPTTPPPCAETPMTQSVCSDCEWLVDLCQRHQSLGRIASAY
eukprot:6186383-Pleurochrysis_carterae.AAC.3